MITILYVPLPLTPLYPCLPLSPTPTQPSCHNIKLLLISSPTLLPSLTPPFLTLLLTSLCCLFSRSQEVTCTVSSALSCMRSSFSLLMRRTASAWRSRSRLAPRSSSVRDDLILDTFHVYIYLLITYNSLFNIYI